MPWRAVLLYPGAIHITGSEGRRQGVRKFWKQWRQELTGPMGMPGWLTSSSEWEGKQKLHISLLSWGLFKCHFFSLFFSLPCSVLSLRDCVKSCLRVLKPPLLYYSKGQWPLTCQSLLPLCFMLLVSIFLVFRKNLLSTNQEIYSYFLSSIFSVCQDGFWVYHPIYSLFQTFIFFFLQQGHENTHTHIQ